MHLVQKIAGELTTREKLIAEITAQQVELRRVLQKAAGLSNADFASTLRFQIELACRHWTQAGDGAEAFAQTVGMLTSLNPKGALQAMLAVQILGVHAAAMTALTKAAAEGVDIEEAEQKINRASKLMRLFAQQVELMARLQGKITTQKVVVERVDIAAGSQAVVGVIEAAKTGTPAD